MLFLRRLSGNLSGASGIYEKLLKDGKAKKACTVCDRHLNAQEMVVFEKYVMSFRFSFALVDLQQANQLKGEMKRSSPQSIAENTDEMKEWEEELERLQKLVPTQASQDRLKGVELPALEKQIKEQEGAIPSIGEKAEKVRRNYDSSCWVVKF